MSKRKAKKAKDEAETAKNAAKLLGSRGGKARAANLTPIERQKIAAKGAIARWTKAAAKAAETPPDSDEEK